MANFSQGEFPWRNTGAKQWRGTSPVGRFPLNGYGLYDVNRERMGVDNGLLLAAGGGVRITREPVLRPSR